MKEVSPFNVVAKYGAFNGLAAFLLFIILWKAGKNPLGSWSIIGWVLPVLFSLISIREHRNKDLGGYISYGRGLGTGMLLSVFAGFLFAVLVYAFIVFFAKDIPQMQIDDFIANMENVRGYIGEDKYNAIMQKFEETKSSFTASGLALSSFYSRMIGGFIISLVAAAIYAKKRPPLETIDTTPSNPS